MRKIKEYFLKEEIEIYFGQNNAQKEQFIRQNFQRIGFSLNTA